AGDLFPDPGVDRLCPEISRSVVGAPAAPAGRRTFHAQPDPSRGGRRLYRNFGDAPDLPYRQPQAARSLEGDAAEYQRPPRGAVGFRLQPRARYYSAGALAPQLH